MWLFKSNREIMVEKSIYIKNDRAIETSQIVISGITSSLRDKNKMVARKNINSYALNFRIRQNIFKKICVILKKA